MKTEREKFEQLEYIKDKLEYLNFCEHLDCYVEKNNGMPVGLAAWVNGAWYGFEQAAKADVRQPIITLTCHQLKQVLEYGAPELEITIPDNEYVQDQLDTEMCISYSNGHSGKGLYCWYAELPEEGSIFLDEEAQEQP